jgi:hypothetical protein
VFLCFVEITSLLLQLPGTTPPLVPSPSHTHAKVNADSHYFHPFLYINREYLKVTLTPPYVNYCYMPIPMPPAHADFHETPSFCALERCVVCTSTTGLATTIDS